MLTIIKLLLLQIIMVFIVDLSGVMDVIKKKVWEVTYPNRKYREFSFKPFDCSLCSVWWTTLLYILFTGNLTLPYIAVCALLSFTASTMSSLLQLIKDLLDRVIYNISKVLDRL